MADKRVTRSASKRTTGLDPLELLDRDAVTAVFNMLGHTNLCHAACVSKAWRDLASCNDVWQKMLRNRWPLLPAAVVASTGSARDMYRKLLPKAEEQHTHASDVLLMVEMLDASGDVLVQGAFPLDELESREVHTDLSVSGWQNAEAHFVLTFPQLLEPHAYERVIQRFRSSTICLIRKRDGKVVRADAHEDAYQMPSIAYGSDHCVFPGNTNSRKLLRNFSANRDPEVRLLEYSIKLGGLSSESDYNRYEDHRGQLACTFGKKETHYTWIYASDENGEETGELELTESDGNDGPRTKYWRIKPTELNLYDRFTEFLSILTWE